MSLFRRSLKVVTVLLGVLVALLAAVAASAFAYGRAESNRITSLPEPTGPYVVGRATYDWVDRSREETFTRKEGDKRELMAFVWYPANRPAAGAKSAPTCRAGGARNGRGSTAACLS